MNKSIFIIEEFIFIGILNRRLYNVNLKDEKRVYGCYIINIGLMIEL